MKEKQPSVRFSRIGNILRVDIGGDIDHHSAAPLREQIDMQIYSARPKEISISLAGVSFMDSAGLGLVVGRLVTAKEVGCTLTLTGVSPRTMKIFEMAGLERMRGLTIRSAEEKRNME